MPTKSKPRLADHPISRAMRGMAKLQESKLKQCRCATRVQRELAKRNTRLVMTFFIGPTRRAPVPSLATERIENLRDGERAATVLPSFCPFCGEKYPDA